MRRPSAGRLQDPNTTADNAFHVVHVSDPLGVIGNTTLDGFTISDGNANGGSVADGEGAGIRTFRRRLTARNCVIKNNRSTRRGAGVALFQALTSWFEDCLFDSNESVTGGSQSMGGAVAGVVQPTPIFIRCEFRNNSADFGGALHFIFQTAVDTGNIRIEDCRFDANVARVDGGAVYAKSGQELTGSGGSGSAFVNPFLRFRRTDFYGNRAVENGGAFYIEGRNARLENCKFGGNFVSTNIGAARGAAIHAATSDEQQPGLVAINCLFTGNASTAGSDAAGALYLAEWSRSNPPEIRDTTANFYNCTFSRNSATGGIGDTDFAEVEVERGDVNFRNCIFWNDATPIARDEIDAVVDLSDNGIVTFQNSLVEGGLPFGATDGGLNLSTNPA